MRPVFANTTRVWRPMNRRMLHVTRVAWAKNDASTIDSFKLPSQTSINEWEFRYDFVPKVSEPKVPPVTPEAVAKDVIAEMQARNAREDQLTKSQSVKVEANLADVFHQGQSVVEDPVVVGDHAHAEEGAAVDEKSGRGSLEVAPSLATKPANRDKYVQSSINPLINDSQVANYGLNEVDHKISEVPEQTPVWEDVEHSNELQRQDLSDPANRPAPDVTPKKEEVYEDISGFFIPLMLIAFGGVGYYYYYYLVQKKQKERKR